MNGNYLAIGIAMGVTLGLAMDNLAVGIAIGVAIGMGLSSASAAKKGGPEGLADIRAIRARADELAQRLDWRGLHVADRPLGDGRPYVTVSDAYYYIVEERGTELERRRTENLDELLYWLFDGATFAAASKYEAGHRIAGEDSRRQLFTRHEALLSRISPEWGRRKAVEHRDVLAGHPFDDSTG